MSTVRPEDVREFLVGFLRKKLTTQGMEVGMEFSDDCDLLLSGVIDSLGLLELVTAVRGHYNRDIDFEALEPEQMTVVGPLCSFIAQEIAKG
jgi:acyl carrier protein